MLLTKRPSIGSAINPYQALVARLPRALSWPIELLLYISMRRALLTESHVVAPAPCLERAYVVGQSAVQTSATNPTLVFF